MSELPGRPPEAKAVSRFGWEMKLRKTDEFSSVFRFKRARRGKCLDVHGCPNALDYPRLGLIVGKKVLPRAIDRNRVKRLLRECFRLAQRDLCRNDGSGLDLVIRVKAADVALAYRLECELLLVAIREQMDKQLATSPVGRDPSGMANPSEKPTEMD